MFSYKTIKYKNIDFIALTLYLFLVVFGYISLYATTHTNNVAAIFKPHMKQLLWMIVTFFCGAFLYKLDFYYQRFSVHIYIFGLFLLTGLFFLGTRINGAISWYQIGGFSLQPSEYAKVFTLLFFARIFEKRVKQKKTGTYLRAFFIVLIPSLLILLQPDPGSVLVYFSLLLIFFRNGLSFDFLIVFTLICVFFVINLFFDFIVAVSLFSIIYLMIVFFLSRYIKIRFKNLLLFAVFLVIVGLSSCMRYAFDNIFQQRHRDRINIILGIKKDIQDIGYNRNQSILSVKSGGFFGKGFLQADRTAGNFVPEQSTDYIFSTVAEQFGFLGSIFIVILFTLFILRLFWLAEHQKSVFNRVYGYGVALIFFVHFFINIGMVLGILPTVGIPLPFFSYGGSSFMTLSILFLLLLRFNALEKRASY